MSDDIWDDLKAKILIQYPHVKTLDLVTYLIVKLFGHKSEYSMSAEQNNHYYTQHAILTSYKGKIYTKEFGKL